MTIIINKIKEYIKGNCKEISLCLWMSIVVLLFIHIITNSINPLIACVFVFILDYINNYIL